VLLVACCLLLAGFYAGVLNAWCWCQLIVQQYVEKASRGIGHLKTPVKPLRPRRCCRAHPRHLVSTKKKKKNIAGTVFSTNDIFGSQQYDILFPTNNKKVMRLFDNRSLAGARVMDKGLLDNAIGDKTPMPQPMVAETGRPLVNDVGTLLSTAEDGRPIGLSL